MTVDDLKIGLRVRSNRAIDIFPLHIWPEGTCGEIVAIETYSGHIAAHIKLDDDYECLDEWDNCLIAYETDAEEALSDADLAAFDIEVGFT